ECYQRQDAAGSHFAPLYELSKNPRKQKAEQNRVLPVEQYDVQRYEERRRQYRQSEQMPVPQNVPQEKRNAQKHAHIQRVPNHPGVYVRQISQRAIDQQNRGGSEEMMRWEVPARDSVLVLPLRIILSLDCKVIDILPFANCQHLTSPIVERKIGDATEQKRPGNDEEQTVAGERDKDQYSDASQSM